MIYNTSSKEVSGIKLWRIDAKTFRILQFGKFTPLMTGSDYTIVAKALLSAFDELLFEEVEVKPIRIIRKATGEQWNDFFELNIKEHIDPDKIKIVDENEQSVWQYNHHLFVSEPIKKKLEALSE